MNNQFIIEHPILIDAAVTRDTTYDEDTYYCTLILADDNNRMEILLEPLKGTLSAYSIFDHIGGEPMSIDFVTDNGVQKHSISFNVRVKDRRGADIMSISKTYPLRSFIMRGRKEITQISFISREKASGLALEIFDSIDKTSKWYNAELPSTRKAIFELNERLFKLQKEDSSCIIRNNTLFIGDLTIPVYTIEKGE